MVMEEKFKSILKDNEKVLFVTNATNSSVHWVAILSTLLSLSFFGTAFITLTFLVSYYFLILYFVLVALVIFSSVMLTKKAIKNYFVCLTNERVIIRNGMFTNNYKKYSIQNVSGNIKIFTNQSFFDRKKEFACSVKAVIELLPVGHSEIYIWTKNLYDGQKLSELLEKTVKANAKKLNIIAE